MTNYIQLKDYKDNNELIYLCLQVKSLPKYINIIKKEYIDSDIKITFYNLLSYKSTKLDFDKFFNDNKDVYKTLDIKRFFLKYGIT